MSKPFLKWAGSKQKLISSFVDLIPKDFGTYYEPFLGSASLFFHLKPPRAVLSDANAELINAYINVRDNRAEVEAIIRRMPTDSESYYTVRANRSESGARRAAEFIYLNKLCWNGLYRVNLAGKFNVPYGANKSQNVLQDGVLEACEATLSGNDIVIKSCDFDSALTDVKSGDFVFLDPPYVTSHNNNGFIEYNENIFSWDDQVRLATLCDRLATRGASVLVTNANHDAVRALYDGFSITEIERMSTLASNRDYRRRVSEVVIFRGSHGGK